MPYDGMSAMSNAARTDVIVPQQGRAATALPWHASVLQDASNEPGPRALFSGFLRLIMHSREGYNGKRGGLFSATELDADWVFELPNWSLSTTDCTTAQLAAVASTAYDIP